MKCATCEEKECYEGKDCTEVRDEVESKYRDDDLKSMNVSARIESEHYMEKTRLEELVLYAKLMGYRKLGLAFCIGLENEARIVNRILENDFDVHSVCCKVCGLDKTEFGLPKLHDEESVEAVCNPIGQALVLENERTELNIALGLCMGHDILFAKHSAAPVTTLAVKDRILAHNPLGAIYSKYYLKKAFDLDEEC